MIILRQKEYMLHEVTRDNNGKLTLGKTIGDGQGYSAGGSAQNAITNSASAVQRVDDANAMAAKRQAKVDYINKAKTQSYQAGQNSVGILGGAKNTWNSLSKNQQLGVAAGGAALAIGGAALLARNRRKRKEAEEELERERRRR
jgi:hypothetical protein